MSDRWAVSRLHMDDLVLTLLPGIGGRLQDVTFLGRSLLFQNPDLTGLLFDDVNLANLPTRSPQFAFPLWGGEKTWIAPDTGWVDGTPSATLDSGPYHVATSGDDHIEMTSAVCPVSHLSVTRRISLRHPNAFTIEHAVTNRGVTARETGIWSVMMIDTPAKIGIAMEDPTIHPVFGSAGALASKNQNGVIAECTRKQEFKIGLPNPDGETFIRFGNGGPWMHCNTPKPKQADRFAHQYPFEIFNSGDYNYCEAEWHSPQANLLPGETLEFRQEFRLWTDHNSSSAPRNIMNNKEFLSCMS